MEVKLTDGYQQRFTSACLAQIGSRKEVTKIENAMKDGKIMLIEVDNTQMAIIKSWNSMKYDRRKNMMIGDCSKELLDKLSKIVRLPPAIESYRQRLDETQRAVDKMRVEKEPEALVKYPVQGSLYEHQVRAANMALLTFGLADPKEDTEIRIGGNYDIR